MTNGTKPNAAVLSAIVALIFIGAALIFGFTVTNPEADSTPMIVMMLGLIGSTVPAVMAAFRSDQVARDVRNGKLVEKVTEGATQALDDAGVTEVMNNAKQTQPAALDALARLVAALDMHDIQQDRRDTEGKDTGR